MVLGHSRGNLHRTLIRPKPFWPAYEIRESKNDDQTRIRGRHYSREDLCTISDLAKRWSKSKSAVLTEMVDSHCTGMIPSAPGIILSTQNGLRNMLAGWVGFEPTKVRQLNHSLNSNRPDSLQRVLGPRASKRH